MKSVKSIIKNISNCSLFYFVKFVKKFSSGRYFLEQLEKNINNQIENIKRNDVELKFYTPNKLNLYRVKTFLSKEPETLDWIDKFNEGSVFWDIGSNIGIFTCYAAKKKNCKVYSFEPSVFNLEVLCKNISLNKLNNLVTVFPLPFSDKIKEGDFNMSSTDKGGAISTFGEDFTYDGSELKTIFNYKTFGVTMDDAIKYFKLPFPSYLKIDVDGIEHLILKGGLSVLEKAKEVLIEVDDKFETQTNQVKEYLEKSGLKLSSKIELKMIQRDSTDKQVCNQVWKREIK